MAQNCHFLNNLVPTVMLAMLSNMNFQATLTKDAVIDYMTKYMTKSGRLMPAAAAATTGATACCGCRLLCGQTLSASMLAKHVETLKNMNATNKAMPEYI